MVPSDFYVNVKDRLKKVDRPDVKNVVTAFRGLAIRDDGQGNDGRLRGVVRLDLV